MREWSSSRNLECNNILPLERFVSKQILQVIGLKIELLNSVQWINIASLPNCNNMWCWCKDFERHWTSIFTYKSLKCLMKNKKNKYCNIHASNHEEVLQQSWWFQKKKAKPAKKLCKKQTQLTSFAKKQNQLISFPKNKKINLNQQNKNEPLSSLSNFRWMSSFEDIFLPVTGFVPYFFKYGIICLNKLIIDTKEKNGYLLKRNNDKSLLSHSFFNFQQKMAKFEKSTKFRYTPKL